MKIELLSDVVVDWINKHKGSKTTAISLFYNSEDKRGAIVWCEEVPAFIYIIFDEEVKVLKASGHTYNSFIKPFKGAEAYTVTPERFMEIQDMIMKKVKQHAYETVFGEYHYYYLIEKSETAKSGVWITPLKGLTISKKRAEEALAILYIADEVGFCQIM